MFSPHERRLLLAYARQILEYEFSGPGSGTPPLPPVEDLKRDGCCFVTLYEGGEIRGCIGNCEAFESFADNLARNVLNAAFSDPGFPPLEPEELPEIRLEISIPGAPEPVRFECAHPEREGLLLRYGTPGAVSAANRPAAGLGQGEHAAVSDAEGRDRAGNFAGKMCGDRTLPLRGRILRGMSVFPGEQLFLPENPRFFTCNRIFSLKK